MRTLVGEYEYDDDDDDDERRRRRRRRRRITGEEDDDFFTVSSRSNAPTTGGKLKGKRNSNNSYMNRDLSGGALFLSTMAYLSFCLSASLPTWWLTTIELQGQMCTCGTGLFAANVTWGDNLIEPHMHYSVDKACHSDNKLMTQGCNARDEAGRQETQWKGYVAGTFIILAILCTVIASVAGWRHGLTANSNPDSNSTPRGNPNPNPTHSLLACYAAASASLLGIVCVALFTSTPLYDNLSYNFACHFIFSHPLNSNPLRCHAIGPSWALAVVGTLLSAVASIMFWFAYKPTTYLHPRTKRYSLFMDLFIKRGLADHHGRFYGERYSTNEYHDNDNDEWTKYDETFTSLQNDATGANADAAAGVGAGIRTVSTSTSASTTSASAYDAPGKYNGISSNGNSSSSREQEKHGEEGGGEEEAFRGEFQEEAFLREIADSSTSGYDIGGQHQHQHRHQKQKQKQDHSILNEYPNSQLPVDTAGPMQRFVRAYGIPTALVANAGLFIYSNCSTGATVEPHITLSFPGWLVDTLRPFLPGLSSDGRLEFRDDVFNFTLVSSLRHFWNGKAYGLALLIGIFSGAWPYVKIFMMLFLWFVPASERLRGRMLLWIDRLGKLSLVDAYVLCLMSVAFALKADADVLGIGVHVDIQVRPGWGVYSFVLATMWSLFMSHWMTATHREAEERRIYTPEFLAATKFPPHEALESRPYAPLSGRRRFRCSNPGRVIIWVVLLTGTVLTLIGQTVRTFDFEFSGLVQLLMPPEDLVTKYSLVSLGQLIPQAAIHGGYLSGGGWAYFLAIMYFLFAMAIPLFRLVLLMILWAVPMTLRSARRLFHTVEVVAAWSAMDVFLVSIIAAVLEIGGLSQDVISSAFGDIQDVVCDILNSMSPSVLEALLRSLGLPEIDLSNGCALFRVDAKLMEGCVMLVIAVVACEVCSYIVMELAEASIKERLGMLVTYQGRKGLQPHVRVPEEEEEEEDDDDGGNAYRDERGRNSQNVHVDGRHTSASGSRELETQNSAEEGRIRNQENGDNDEEESHEGTNAPSRPLRRLLSAQEEGGKRFLGFCFGDFMYGPFPRTMWSMMASIGIVQRVDWEQLGDDLQQALVPPSPVVQHGHVRSSQIWAAESPLQQF